MNYDLFAFHVLGIWTSNEDGKGGQRFWLSTRNKFPVDSRMFSVSLTGHQWHQSAAMPAFGGGKACNHSPSAETPSIGWFSGAQPSLGQLAPWTLGSGMAALMTQVKGHQMAVHEELIDNHS